MPRSSESTRPQTCSRERVSDCRGASSFTRTLPHGSPPTALMCCSQTALSSGCQISESRGYRRMVQGVGIAAFSCGAGSFDHLVGAREQRRWHLQAKRLGGLKIDRELEL